MATKAQLQAEVEALRHNNEVLRTERDSLVAERDESREWFKSALATIEELKAQPVPTAKRVVAHRPRTTVFEWDAKTPGDFARASALAKQFNGVVRRAN